MPPARIVLWVASLGGIALLLRSFLIGPVPMWFAVAAFVAYATLCTVGVLVPQLEMFGNVLWRAEPGARAVALTFDDGPFPETTRKVLKILEAGGHKATFFVMGRKVRKFPELVKEIHDAGHELGLHGFEHDRLYALKPPRYVADDIARTQTAVEKACGVRPLWFRPPIGYVSSRTAAGAKRAGVRIVAWSARGIDGLGETDPDRVSDRVLGSLSDGGIALLHDAAEKDDFEPASVRALPRILEELEAQKLRAVTLSELFGAETQEEEAGREDGAAGREDGAEAGGSSITNRAPSE